MLGVLAGMSTRPVAPEMPAPIEKVPKLAITQFGKSSLGALEGDTEEDPEVEPLAEGGAKRSVEDGELEGSSPGVTVREALEDPVPVGEAVASGVGITKTQLTQLSWKELSNAPA